MVKFVLISGKEYAHVHHSSNSCSTIVNICSAIIRLGVHGSVHRNINLIERTNKIQLFIEFIIPMFFNCSTCFGRHTAHHEELKNCNCSLWFYIQFLQFLSSWWWVACRSKHVEQLRNIGIINSTTRSHLVGYFYTIYNMTHGSINIIHSLVFSP
jgi:hypothetical protein